MRGEWVPPQGERPRSRSVEGATRKAGSYSFPQPGSAASTVWPSLARTARVFEPDVALLWRSRPTEVNVNSTGANPDTSTELSEVGTIDMNLEVVTSPVSDVDRAKRSYAVYPLA
jgi:hypothetical protein